MRTTSTATLNCKYDIASNEIAFKPVDGNYWTIDTYSDEKFNELMTLPQMQVAAQGCHYLSLIHI